MVRVKGKGKDLSMNFQLLHDVEVKSPFRQLLSVNSVKTSQQLLKPNSVCFMHRNYRTDVLVFTLPILRASVQLLGRLQYHICLRIFCLLHAYDTVAPSHRH